MNSVHTELKHVCTAVLDIGFSVFIVFKSIEGAICSINLNEIKNLELVLIKKREIPSVHSIHKHI